MKLGFHFMIALAMHIYLLPNYSTFIPIIPSKIYSVNKNMVKMLSHSVNFYLKRSNCFTNRNMCASKFN